MFAKPSSPRPAAGGGVRRRLTWLAVVLLALAVVWVGAAPASADTRWQEAADAVTSLLEEVPALYAGGDVKAVEATIRKAYYEE